MEERGGARSALARGAGAFDRTSPGPCPAAAVARACAKTWCSPARLLQRTLRRRETVR